MLRVRPSTLDDAAALAALRRFVHEPHVAERFYAALGYAPASTRLRRDLA
ncbi:MAG: hypothetical protein IT460_15345 [Planctomycetes bacterium]|nr:hypothetical protein [Planctomycetota bacterium]